jgi:hypothetical protein
MAMNEQQVFDRVVLHLMKQNERSQDPEITLGNGCMYRDPKGNKCAVGCLIPDEMYVPEMERKNVYRLTGAFPQVRDLFKGPRVLELLSQLQGIHDTGGNATEWYVPLLFAAEEFNLHTKIFTDKDYFGE